MLYNRFIFHERNIYDVYAFGAEDVQKELEVTRAFTHEDLIDLEIWFESFHDEADGPYFENESSFFDGSDSGRMSHEMSIC